jgi:hypothetical protein
MLRRRKPVPGPPGESAVVDRVLCVSAIAMLGAVAAAVAEREMDDDAAEKYLVESRRWLIREGLSGALSAGEKRMLAKPMAEWTAGELDAASRRNEAVGVLLWAIAAVAELPPHDMPFERLPSDVPLLAPTAGFRSAARRRPPEDVERARAATELRQRQASTSRAEDGDATASGTAVAGADELAALEVIAAERHDALAWLTGAAGWHDVPAGA